MTKVEIGLPLHGPVSSQLVPAIAKAHKIYGIFRVWLENERTVRVEFDASRLTGPEVEAALAQLGLPVIRRQSGSTP